MRTVHIFTPPMSLEGLDHIAIRNIAETYLMVIADIIEGFNHTRMYYISHFIVDGKVSVDINTSRFPTYKNVLNMTRDYDFKGIMRQAASDMGLKQALEVGLYEDYSEWHNDWFTAYLKAIVICRVSTMLNGFEEYKVCTEQELVDYLRAAYKNKLEEGITESQRDSAEAKELISEVFNIRTIDKILEDMTRRLLALSTDNSSQDQKLELANTIKNETLENIVNDFGDTLLTIKTDDEFFKPDDYYW